MRIPVPAAGRQRGVGALIVVMLLFFIVSMVAAYTGRNMIFEQKTSANQYRSTQAFETADAGVEWALGQLNAGRTDGTCVPTTSTTPPTFRDRYLSIGATGLVTARLASGGGSVNPICVFDSSDADRSRWKWSCSCPASNAGPSSPPADPAVSGPAPAFGLTFFESSRPGVVLIEADSCTRLATSCLYSGAPVSTGDSVASIVAMLALKSALAAPPDAALTAGGTVGAVPSGATLTLVNAEPAKNGVTVHAAGGVDRSNGPVLTTTPGAPTETSVLSSDATLAPAAVTSTDLPLTTAERSFINVFGLRPGVYRRLPGTVVFACPTSCTASADIAPLLLLNPGRPIWITGAGTLTLDVNLGNTGAPALLLVQPNVTVSGTPTLVGFLYGNNASWLLTNNGTLAVEGAVYAEGNIGFAGAGSTTIRYSSSVLNLMRSTYGSFVRVPGGWRDFNQT